MAVEKLTEEQSRLIVITNVFNMVLQPTLVGTIPRELKLQYFDLDQRYDLKNQTFENHITKDENFTYNYGSINENHKRRRRKKWNYAIKDENDLAKLYMRPFMAKFEGISDGSFDLSASLSVLGNCSAFSPDLQQAAHDVRAQVRNRWAHSNLNEWTEDMFNESLCQIRDLVTKLRIPYEETVSVLDSIQRYKEEGLKYSSGIEVNNEEISKLVYTLKSLQFNHARSQLKRKKLQLEVNRDYMLNSLGKNFSRLVEETEDIIVHHSVTEDEYIATGRPYRPARAENVFGQALEGGKNVVCNIGVAALEAGADFFKKVRDMDLTNAKETGKAKKPILYRSLNDLSKGSTLAPEPISNETSLKSKSSNSLKLCEMDTTETEKAEISESKKATFHGSLTDLWHRSFGSQEKNSKPTFFKSKLSDLKLTTLKDNARHYLQKFTMNGF